MARMVWAAGLAALMVAQGVEAAQPVRAAGALPPATQPDAAVATRAASPSHDGSSLVGAPLIAVAVALGASLVVVAVALNKARSPG